MTARKTGLRLLLGVFVCYALYGVVLSFFQRSIIFPRHLVQVPAEGGAGVRDLERWWLDTDGGKVEAWFLIGDGRTAEDPGPAVIFAHGNAEAIDFWPFELERYRRLGISVLLPEYRGYGRSGGAPSQDAITRDFVAFYDRLAALPQVDRIFFHGRSLGGGAVGALAAERPCAALILQSTFTSIASFATQFFLPRLFVSDPFDTQRVVEGLEVPVLVLHGTRDTVVPYEHAEALRRSAKNGRLVRYDCGHNDFPNDDRVWKPIESFLRAAELLDP